MKIVQINTFPYKATGTIMLNLHNILLQNGHDSYVAWGRGRNANDDREIVIKDDIGVKIHGLYTRLTDRTGFASIRATKKLIWYLDKIKPDIIHLHNVHGYYINIELLFKYIKDKKIKVVWTLHDCWAMTGHCAWFDMAACNKWKTGCSKCTQLRDYPASSLIDGSQFNWNKKRELFTGLNCTIVTPCKWLSQIVKQSYLNKYPCKVIYNGIDLEIFKPSSVEQAASTIKKYELTDKPIVLGGASEWTERKGLNDIIKISEKLCGKYQFVVVGLTKKQLESIPKTITGITRTNNITELVNLYSVATLFFNPTYEDNFPTTNIEALACGTPVLTYDTGGSPEAIQMAKQHTNIFVGNVVSKASPNTVDLSTVSKVLTDSVEHTIVHRSKVREACRKVSMEFDKEKRLGEYLNLYF